MAVYLGTSGLIQLSRVGESPFFSEMDPGDVDVTEKRFSFDFPNGTFITGDRLTISRVNADGTPSSQNLDFVDSHPYPDGTWYVHVDSIGGLRLYSDWGAALSGSKEDALVLTVPASTYRIRVELQGATPNCLGQVTEYSIQTQRDVIDVTSLGDSFQERYSGLISGSGELTAYWDWLPQKCGVGDQLELPQYFHQLILRQQLGSEFRADFFIKRSFAEPMGEVLSAAQRRTTIYYSVRGVVTNVSMAFQPTEPLRSVVQFVTTGPIELLYGIPAGFSLLQEDSFLILQEDGQSSVALEED